MQNKANTMKWTVDQQRVIDVRNCNVLVSAAAGSGKTAVLVQRIINIVESGINIDRLLIVTFTRAAASEMKERISLALEKKIEENPNDAHLQRQMLLIHNAKITTIDSFCLNVVKNYFNEIDLNPGFRIADESELKLIKKDVVDRVLEKYYEENNEDFIELIEAYADAKSDKNIEDIILKIYNTSTSYPWPLEWLEENRERFFVENLEDMQQSDWMKNLMKYIHTIAKDLKSKNEFALEICNSFEGPHKYIDTLLSDADIYDSIITCSTYQELYKVLNTIKFDALARKKEECSAFKMEQVKEIRKLCKKDVEKIKSDYFFQEPEKMIKDICASKKTMNKLIDITKDFYEEFAKEKAERNVYYFSDIEFFALNILVKKVDGKIIPTEVADTLSHYFEEILIDEYQDSNNVQETLLNAISKERFGKVNVFMVGDVKQSIYKFRMAKPELFMEKFDTYNLDNTGDYQRIDLRKNFRSRKVVLDGINYIFEKIMTKKVGNIEYNELAKLYEGREYPNDDENYSKSCEMLLFNQDGVLNDVFKKEFENIEKIEKDDEEIEYTKKEIEAKIIVKKIKEITNKDNGLIITSKDADGNDIKKRAEYKDIAILFRSVNSYAEALIDTFSEENIPMFIESATGYFSTIEVRTALNLLRIINNPRQDIALAAVITSPIGNITNNELAIIRSCSDEKQELYCSLLSYLKDGSNEIIRSKVDTFLLMLRKYRKIVPFVSVHELLQKALEETGYYNYVYAMPDGEKRRMNLDMLIERAVTYESASYKGLFNFIRSIEQMEKYNIDFGEAKTIGGNDNFVKIMTIHKSKGLEFPVVFVCGLGQRFNTGDTRGKILIHPDFGLAPDYVDTKLRIKSKTLLKKTIANVINQENIGEELRVLYVALTRAKEKLILTGCAENVADMLNKYAKTLISKDKQFSYEQLTSVKTDLDLIIPALMKHQGFEHILSDLGINNIYEYDKTDSNWKIEVVGAEKITIDDVTEKLSNEMKKQEVLEFNTSIMYDEKIYERLEKMKDYHYKYDKEIDMKVKFSVSELKKMGQMEKDEEELLWTEQEKKNKHIQEEQEKYIPQFMQETKKVEVAPNEIGTVYHKILQLLNFEQIKTETDIKNRIAEMVYKGHFEESKTKYISTKKIYNFVKSDIAMRINEASKKNNTYKEQQFVIGINGESEELVLIQGVIDLYFEEEDGLVLMDYKTDRVSEEDILIKRYKKQLDYYKAAIEQLTGKKVKEKVIYSFALEKEIKVD